MKYEHPNVAFLASAASAVQGNDKSDVYPQDNLGIPVRATQAAYQADE